MKRTIAFVGNPNSGKTSLFNELTGANQYVGNWPGVTVECKGGTLRDHDDIELQDLPGIYSLSPYSPEEIIARNYLSEGKPDLIVNVVDATNLERNLYLSSQLFEMGIPVIIALNMIDLTARSGVVPDAAALSHSLGCPVVETSALKLTGLHKLIELMLAPIPAAPTCLRYAPSVEEVLSAIAERCGCNRWNAVKLLENDRDTITAVTADDQTFIAGKREYVEQIMQDDIASVIAAGRYDAILALIPQVLKRTERRDTLTEKIDRVVTHRYFGILLFAAVMWLIYYISIGTVGTWGTDWANDVLFGPVIMGWLRGFIGDTPAPLESMVQFSAVLAMVFVFPSALRRVHDLGLSGSWLYLGLAPFLLEYMCPHLPEPAHTILMDALLIINAFMLLVGLTFPGTKSTNKYGATGQRIKFNLMSLNGRGSRTEFALWLVICSALSFGAAQLGTLCLDCSPQLQALIGDGIVAGVGAILGFLPQMAVLFLILTFLEDCGYMARVAFMMDRIFRSIGLSGKSFIPLMVAMGCGVPGIMATRTIEGETDRRLSVMLTTMIPCGAKLPVIALFAALLGQDANIATIAYFAGIGSVICGALILRKTRLFAGGYTPFVMELPTYHLPSGANINIRAMERCQAFVKKAGTVIFAASALVWTLSHYSWSFSYLENAGDEATMSQSMLHDVGQLLAPVFAPLGWNSQQPDMAWKPAVATVTGLIAKENIVSTIEVLFPKPKESETTAEEEEEFEQTALLPKCNALTALTMGAWLSRGDIRGYQEEEGSAEEVEEEDNSAGIAAGIKAAGVFTAFSALSFMLFNLLCIPCFAACGAIRREMNSAKWTAIALGFMSIWAYMVAFLVYQIGTAVTDGHFGIGTAVAALVGVILLVLILRPKPDKTL